MIMTRRTFCAKEKNKHSLLVLASLLVVFSDRYLFINSKSNTRLGMFCEPLLFGHC